MGNKKLLKEYVFLLTTIILGINLGAIIANVIIFFIKYFDLFWLLDGISKVIDYIILT